MVLTRVQRPDVQSGNDQLHYTLWYRIQVEYARTTTVRRDQKFAFDLQLSRYSRKSIVEGLSLEIVMLRLRALRPHWR